MLLELQGLEKYRDAIKEGSSVSIRTQQLIIQTLLVITSTSKIFISFSKKKNYEKTSNSKISKNFCSKVQKLYSKCKDFF